MALRDGATGNSVGAFAAEFHHRSRLVKIECRLGIVPMSLTVAAETFSVANVGALMEIGSSWLLTQVYASEFVLQTPTAAGHRINSSPARGLFRCFHQDTLCKVPCAKYIIMPVMVNQIASSTGGAATTTKWSLRSYVSSGRRRYGLHSGGDTRGWW